MLLSKHPATRWTILDALGDILEKHQHPSGELLHCYLSGPMTGLPDYNIHAFALCAAMLREAGWEVFSPHENDEEAGVTLAEKTGLEVWEEDGLEGFSFKKAMAKDLWQVCSSDAVFVMPGWEHSTGCQLEVDVAHRVGVPVYSILSGREIEAPEEEPHEFSSRVASSTAEPLVVNQDDAGSSPAPPFVLDCGPTVLFIDPATGGQKNESQARFDLVPPDALTELARVYGMGAAKYEANNYLKGYPWHLSIAALERHVQKFKAGEDIDPESGLHHLSHAAWQAFTLVVFSMRGLGTDDRTPTRRVA